MIDIAKQAQIRVILFAAGTYCVAASMVLSGAPELRFWAGFICGINSGLGLCGAFGRPFWASRPWKAESNAIPPHNLTRRPKRRR